MKRLFAILLLALALPAAAYDCFPSTWVPTPGTGTPYVAMTVGRVETFAWWCRRPARAGDLDGKLYYVPQFFLVHADDKNLTLFKDALLRVAAAPDMLKQANVEMDAARTVLVPGSPKEYEYRVAGYAACNGLKDGPIANVAFDTPLPADWCGAAPVPVVHVVSPYPGATHRATYATTLAFGGTRATLTNGKVPILTNGASTPCACTAGYVTERNAAGVTITYCSVLGVARQVANCSQP